MAVQRVLGGRCKGCLVVQRVLGGGTKGAWEPHAALRSRQISGWEPLVNTVTLLSIFFWLCRNCFCFVMRNYWISGKEYFCKCLFSITNLHLESTQLCLSLFFSVNSILLLTFSFTSPSVNCIKSSKFIHLFPLLLWGGCGGSWPRRTPNTSWVSAR